MAHEAVRMHTEPTWSWLIPGFMHAFNSLGVGFVHVGAPVRQPTSVFLSVLTRTGNLSILGADCTWINTHMSTLATITTTPPPQLNTSGGLLATVIWGSQQSKEWNQRKPKDQS